MINLISDDGYEVKISDSDFSKETKMFFKKSMTQQELNKLGTSKYNSFIHHLSKKGYQKMAYGGMTPGRYYRDNKGEEYRFVGESDGKLLFKDGETVVTKTESDFEEEPREKKLFKFFAEGGTVTKMERKAKAGAKKVVKAVSGAGKVSVGEIAKLAKSIRKEGEKWTDAIKRATAQLKK